MLIFFIIELLSYYNYSTYLFLFKDSDFNHVDYYIVSI
ncbi:hypothetical protein FHS90_004474 [Rufibacter quisquiliarum]|uniref:Uncharacterized protein n=1 Tax=Rufibacter quisquiliarum TaxID=1549639 RepID=A0A839GJE4_9BACT|nr:hypothetical protein [Rufibacter quisquiliarum]